MTPTNTQLIVVDTYKQQMSCYSGDDLFKTYHISTGLNGLGEQKNSGCTPRGWHTIHSIIGREHSENAVFIGRTWTGEYYSPELAAQFPERDWILTRILQLDGLEKMRNAGGAVDSLERYIYIHGTPDSTVLGVPASKGCVRMHNKDVIELADWVKPGTHVCIEQAKPYN